jgi:putative monooxygenase
VPAQEIRKVCPDDVAPNRRLGGEIRILLSPTTVGSTSGFLGIGELPPGERGVMHYHPYSEEFMYLVSGAIVAVVGGERITVTPARR